MTGTDDRAELAAWYWREIDEAWSAHFAAHPEDLTGGQKIQDLISAAICAGVTDQFVDVGDGLKVRLRELVAPFRLRPGGLAEQQAAERARVLYTPYGGPRWER